MVERLRTSASLRDEGYLTDEELAAQQAKISLGNISRQGTQRAAIDVLVKIRALDVRVSLDDDGTRYSSLSCLRDLPIDEIKIDWSFVSAIDADQRTASIVASTIELRPAPGRRRGRRGDRPTTTVRRQLAEMGCDVGRGYLMSRPLPAGELLPLLRSDAPLSRPARSSASAPKSYASIPIVSDRDR